MTVCASVPPWPSFSVSIYIKADLSKRELFITDGIGAGDDGIDTCLLLLLLFCSKLVPSC